MTIGGMGGLRHGQDMDYSMRIYNAGFKVGLIADAYVYRNAVQVYPSFPPILIGELHASIYPDAIHTRQTDSPAPGPIIVGLVTGIIPFSQDKIHPPVHFVWNIAGHGLMFVCLFAFFQSLFRYRNIIVAFLSIITLSSKSSLTASDLLWEAGMPCSERK